MVGRILQPSSLLSYTNTPTNYYGGAVSVCPPPILFRFPPAFLRRGSDMPGVGWRHTDTVAHFCVRELVSEY